MTDADPSKLRRIRALLNLAEHVSTPEDERAAALEAAMRLMALYGIERAHLAASNPTSDPIDGTWVDLAEPYGAAKGNLMNRVAEPLRCRTLLYQVGRGNKRISVVGAASDRERTIMLYTSLLVQCATEVSRIKGGTAGRSRSLRNAFMYGYANRIHDRLQEFEKRAVDETSDPTGTALVLVDRATLVDQRFAELFPDARNLRKVWLNTEAYDQGANAANRADIGITRVGENSRVLTR